MNHSGTKTIQTPRLILRQFVCEDSNDMLKNWISNPGIQFEYGEPVYSTKEQVDELLMKWINNYMKPDFYRWAIVEKESGENIGQTAFCRVYSDCRTAEIEYCISEAFWGKGYAVEALSAVIEFAFRETDFFRVEAYHRIANGKSGRVLEKSAMHITDNVERFKRVNTVPHDEICYCITRNDMKNG